MHFKMNVRLIGIISALVLAIVVLIGMVFLWPKSFVYSECGHCKMLGTVKNIERLEAVHIGPAGLKITAIVNTACGQQITAKQEIFGKKLILRVKPSGNVTNSGCICDREVTFNLPFVDAKTVELYYENRLLDERSIVNGKLSDGIEFCEDSPAYKPSCYYRLAFMKKNPKFCDKTPNPKKCRKQLNEFLMLTCLKNYNESRCRALFLK